jgi:DNA-binding MarR family transcriptional regulator
LWKKSALAGGLIPVQFVLIGIAGVTMAIILRIPDARTQNILRIKSKEGILIADFTSPQETKDSKEVQRSSTDIELLHILGFVRGNLSQKQIQEKLNLKKSTLSMKLKKLQEDGLIQRIPHTYPAFYGLTDEGKNAIRRIDVQRSSVGLSRNKIRLHYFSIKMPLVRDVSQGFWEKGWNLNGWKRQFKDLQDVGVSVERTTKSIIVNLKPMSIRKDIVENTAHDAARYMVGFLKEHGIEVDYQSREVSRQEYAVPTKLVRPFTDKGMTVQVKLGRYVQKIFDNDKPQEAVAHFDDSMGNGGEIESNDLPYAQNIETAEALCLMPEGVRKVMAAADSIEGLWKLQKVYADNLTLHMAVMQDIRKWVRKATVQLEQRSVRDFV